MEDYSSADKRGTMYGDMTVGIYKTASRRLIHLEFI
jgi:hypothetical protein